MMNRDTETSSVESGQLHLIGREHDAFAERPQMHGVQTALPSKSPGESPVCQTFAKDFVFEIRVTWPGTERRHPDWLKGWWS